MRLVRELELQCVSGASLARCIVAGGARSGAAAVGMRARRSRRRLDRTSGSSAARCEPAAAPARGRRDRAADTAPRAASPSRGVSSLPSAITPTSGRHARACRGCARSSTRRTSRPSASSPRSAGSALAPTVRGNNIYSPNTEVSLSEPMGLAWRVGIEGVIPLWTFGKITQPLARGRSADQRRRSRRHQAEKPGQDGRAQGLLRLAARARFAGPARATRPTSSTRPIEHLEREVEAGNADEIDLSSCRPFATSSTGGAPKPVATKRSRSRRSVF